MATKESPKMGFIYRLTTSIDDAFRKFFFKVGYFVAGRPILCIILSLTFTCATLAGMLRFQSESRPQNLWVPQNTVAIDNFEYVRERYGTDARFSNILCAGNDDSVNLASKAPLLECLKIAETGFNTKGPKLEGELRNASFPLGCIKTQDTMGRTLCTTISPFAFFYNPKDVVPSNDDILGADFYGSVRKTIEGMTDAQIKNVFENGPFVSASGSPVDAKDMVSSTGTGNSFSVSAILYTQFNNANTEVIAGEEVDKVNDALEEAWTKSLLDDRDALGVSSVKWEVQSTFSEVSALAGALSGDLPLFSIGFVLLTFYVIFFLGDFHVVRSRQVLAVFGLVNAGLALGVTFGLSSAFGMFFGPVHQILPLLIIGIGVDDVFVVTRALDEVNSNPKFAEKPVRTRVALALSKAGSAITITSITNTVVFLLGAISRLPALRFFALWAAIGVAFDWAFTCCFYTATLALDTRRQAAKRRDCIPCFKISADREPATEKNWFRRPPGGFTRFFENQFGPFIMKKPVRFTLLALFLGLFAACIYGVSQLYLKFEFAFFYPSGSDQRNYQDLLEANFQNGEFAPIYLSDTDISTAENQRKYMALCNPDTGAIANNKWIENNSVDCWYESFRATKNLSGDQVVPPATFYLELGDFLKSPAGFKYNRDFSFRNGTFDSVRFSARKVYTPTNSEEITALLSIRESADEAGFGSDSLDNPRAFTFNFPDLFTEQYKALPREIGISLGLASAAVAIVSFVIVGHPIVAGISVLVVGMIIIDVLGFTFFTGVNINSISVITIVIATGIAVDYVVHVTRSFLEQVGTREQRAIKALAALGPPVFYAGFSTFLAIIVLAGATSYIFRVIFFGFFVLIIVGLSHGLILGPIILSLIGPGSFFSSEEEKENAEMELLSMGDKTAAEEPPVEEPATNEPSV